MQNIKLKATTLRFKVLTEEPKNMSIHRADVLITVVPWQLQIYQKVRHDEDLDLISDCIPCILRRDLPTVWTGRLNGRRPKL